MIPGNSLTLIPVPTSFSGARALTVTRTVDYEDGGIAIQDPSQGSNYQRWRGRLIGDDIILDAPEVEPFTVFSAPGITEFSFTFDQNMRPAIAYVQAGVAKLRWFDSAANAQVITTYPGAITPRVTLDDKRFTQTSSSDVILGYVRDGALYYRQQRDRYTVERLLDPGPHIGLVKIGFNVKLSLQFLMEIKR
tara:strand:- start:3343 stop:3918 length:576 start_codon:yes stop_codon:yes gene_type:complete